MAARSLESRYDGGMSTFPVPLGALEISVHLPGKVRDAMLPAYLRPVTAAIFPRGRLDLHFHFPTDHDGAVDCSGEYGLGRAACIGPDPGSAGETRSWRFFVHLPDGPERPDRLPTKCVIPCLYIALRSLGIYAVHASAVARNGGAIVIAGATGHGKSTTAAALTERGATPLADDRVLLVEHDHRWWVTASPERPNPFARRAGYPAEVGPIPRRVEDDRNLALPLAQLVFPRVHPGEPSLREEISSAQAAALLAAAGGPPVISSSSSRSTRSLDAPVSREGRLEARLEARLPPAVRLTLGLDAATIFSRL